MSESPLQILDRICRHQVTALEVAELQELLYGSVTQAATAFSMALERDAARPQSPSARCYIDAVPMPKSYL